MNCRYSSISGASFFSDGQSKVELNDEVHCGWQRAEPDFQRGTSIHADVLQFENVCRDRRTKYLPVGVSTFSS
jgi:hypothetical protein